MNDTLNSTTGSADAFTAAAGASREKIKSDIITGSLDTLNNAPQTKAGSGSSMQAAMSASYDFNKSVLSAEYTPMGQFLTTRG